MRGLPHRAEPDQPERIVRGRVADDAKARGLRTGLVEQRDKCRPRSVRQLAAPNLEPAALGDRLRGARELKVAVLIGNDDSDIVDGK